MYPQTHIFFAEKVLGRQNDSIALGSIFPDMIIGKSFTHQEAHSRGAELYRFLREKGALGDFRKAVVTHGFDPRGLDYYGDEKYLDYERGYCFEKGRPFVPATVMACNIPYEMGWWKSHNIIEMGIELLISAAGYYSEQIKSALTNRELIQEVDEMTRCLWRDSGLRFFDRARRFSGFVEVERATAASLAEKYRVQMRVKHGVEIDTRAVARLIDRAAGEVSGDVYGFFDDVAAAVKKNIASLDRETITKNF
ncbi:MAG: hypothetical protein K6T80_06110 [Firmicutes bacterium]|nr:hypothetical protein [Bacillota bacterium]